MFINGQLVRHASYTYTAPPGGTPSHPRARKHNGRPIGQTCRHGSGCRSDSETCHTQNKEAQGGTRRRASESHKQEAERNPSNTRDRGRDRERTEGARCCWMMVWATGWIFQPLLTLKPEAKGFMATGGIGISLATAGGCGTTHWSSHVQRYRRDTGNDRP